MQRYLFNHNSDIPIIFGSLSRELVGVSLFVFANAGPDGIWHKYSTIGVTVSEGLSAVGSQSLLWLLTVACAQTVENSVLVSSDNGCVRVRLGCFAEGKRSKLTSGDIHQLPRTPCCIPGSETLLSTSPRPSCPSENGQLQ